MALWLQQGKHVSDGIIGFLNVFEDADARNEVKPIRQASRGNVVVNNVVMSIQHSIRPVITNIIRCGHQAPAISHQMRQRRSTRAYIKNRAGIDFPEFSEHEAKLNWPFIESGKGLGLKLPSAYRLQVSIPKVLDPPSGVPRHCVSPYRANALPISSGRKVPR